MRSFLCARIEHVSGDATFHAHGEAPFQSPHAGAGGETTIAERISFKPKTTDGIHYRNYLMETSYNCFGRMRLFHSKEKMNIICRIHYSRKGAQSSLNSSSFSCSIFFSFFFFCGGGVELPDFFAFSSDSKG